jgi:hypothetical protein
MTRPEKIKQFFEQLPIEPTVRDIRDAAAAVGDYSDIADVIAGYIGGREIAGASATIAGLSGDQEQARQKAAQNQAAADLAAKAGELAAGDCVKTLFFKSLRS